MSKLAYCLVGLYDFVEFDYGWVGEAAQHLHLVVDARSLFRTQFLLLVYLDCDLALVAEVHSAPDKRMSPSAQVAVELDVGEEFLDEPPLPLFKLSPTFAAAHLTLLALLKAISVGAFLLLQLRLLLLAGLDHVAALDEQ